MDYKSALNHLENCPMNLYACSNNCGMSFNLADMKAHLAGECPRLKEKCETCMITFEPNNKNKPKHSCVENLKNLIGEIKKEHLNLEVFVGTNYNLLQLCCPSGSPMVIYSGSVKIKPNSGDKAVILGRGS